MKLKDFELKGERDFNGNNMEWDTLSLSEIKKQLINTNMFKNIDMSLFCLTQKENEDFIFVNYNMLYIGDILLDFKNDNQSVRFISKI